MLKYYDTAVVLQEIPDEISLAINITSCPNNCKNCHSPWLREDIGTDLTYYNILDEIKKHKGISCVLFMGGDRCHEQVIRICAELRYQYKTAVYSGNDEIDQRYIPVLDYYKVGSYKEEFGPLNCKTTNQKLYKIVDNQLTDITSKFWH